MQVKCVKSVNNPDIRIGIIYEAQRNTFGWSVKYAKGSHVMPDKIFNESFEEIKR